MKRLVIAIDCDDVLTDTLPHVVRDYNKLYGTQVELKHMYNELQDTLEVFGVKAAQEVIRRLHSLYRTDGYYQRLPLISGAQDAVTRLARSHELHIVTGRQSFLEAATRETADHHFPGMFNSIVHTNYYQDEDEKDAVHRSKGDVCNDIGADILIDDHIAHALSVLEKGVGTVLLFGEYPWNSGKKLQSGIVRCLDWGDVERNVNQIANA